MRGVRYSVWLVTMAAAAADPPTTVEFNRDIRPLLSDRCYTCHGPDQANRKTKLRFDVEEVAKSDLGGRFALVAADPAKSEMIRRITSQDPVQRMPPAWAGHNRLGDRDIHLLRRWIEQGARWEKHWSLIPPRRRVLPEVKDKSWSRNAIDPFVLERLEREGMKPSPEAGRERLIRRAALDLTGLPPEPAEVDAFLADRSPDAYEKLVDGLLESPRYGERMAARWLDAARYADTNGYQTDAERFMWRWRDWVIEAFNRNQPFDLFTLEQIAGDMLPNATLDQKIATGFNRNHRGNGEGGIIPEEYAVEYVADRVETTATVWLGATLGCARCHDHKYDPFLQKDYYRLFAYFNNIPEKGRANKYGNSAPLIPAPTPPQQAELRRHDELLAAAEKKFRELEPEARRAQRDWEKSLAGSTPVYWSAPAGRVARFFVRQELDGQRVVEAGDVGNFGFLDKFTLAARIYPTAATGAILTRATEVLEGDGYGIYLKDGRVQLNLVQRWLDDALRVETEAPLDLNRWRHVLATYDGSRESDGVRIYVDGRPQKLRILLDELNQDFAVKEPLRIGGGGGLENRFRGSIEEAHVYNVALNEREAGVAAVEGSIQEIAALPVGQRTPAHADQLAWYFLEERAPGNLRQAWSELQQARRQRQRFVESIPTVMVMQEQETPRDTFLLVRGAYDRPGEKVTPGVPAALQPLPKGAANNRLGFARWLVDPANPFTARVIVNRFWLMYFGVGLVKTVEDFGSQGEWPSHPELLDWLATEFLRSGWDVKALQKLIVTSATYRQASRVSPGLAQKDPENRLLARGPRVRLPAETVRDQALAISGLLVDKIGGPSVKPYQPAGLWRELSGGQDYRQDHGENLYRRSLYTFWKRAVPPPALMLFDSAGREACTVRESRTNTPLQALTLMNDVTYMEAARVLAERMMREGGNAPAERAAWAFRRATARLPGPRETQTLLDSFHYYLDQYRTNPEAARKLISQGESPGDQKLDSGELAAYTSVASLILNLDEVVTKE